MKRDTNEKREERKRRRKRIEKFSELSGPFVPVVHNNRHGNHHRNHDASITGLPTDEEHSVPA